MKIALVAEDATALSHATSNEPATQESRVAALAAELARQQHEVTVYARRDAADLPEQAKLAHGATVRYVPAGPAEPLADEDVLPHIRSFSDTLAELWRRDKPDVVHAIGWTRWPHPATAASRSCRPSTHCAPPSAGTTSPVTAPPWPSTRRPRAAPVTAWSGPWPAGPPWSSRPTRTKCPTWPGWACRGPASACCRSASTPGTSPRRARSPRA